MLLQDGHAASSRIRLPSLVFQSKDKLMHWSRFRSEQYASSSATATTRHPGEMHKKVVTEANQTDQREADGDTDHLHIYKVPVKMHNEMGKMNIKCKQKNSEFNNTDMT